jgi:CRP-like cAMP-binding protein
MSQKQYDFPLNPRKSMYFDESSIEISNLVSLLRSPSSQRAPSSIKALQILTKNIPFFKQLILDYEEKAHIECCSSLKHIFMERGSIVCEAGEAGDLFYIILKGSVKVLVPDEYSRVLLESTILLSGCAFGEFALVKNKPRTATVVCFEDTHFAILSKKDFVRILGNFTNKRFDEMTEFLKKLPIFNGWSMNSLVRLSYLFKIIKYKRGQRLFREGDPADSVFIVKNGEFELTKEIMIKSSPHLVIGKIGRPLKTTRKQKTFLQGKLSIVSLGVIIGDDDVLNGDFYLKTCTCYSSQAEVLKISAVEFKKRIRNEESLTVLAEKNAFRTNHISSAVMMIKQIQTPNKKKEKMLKVINDKQASDSRCISPAFESFTSHRSSLSICSPLFKEKSSSQIVLELKSLWR